MFSVTTKRSYFIVFAGPSPHALKSSKNIVLQERWARAMRIIKIIYHIALVLELLLQLFGK
jgi:hypothetical protein